jgi:hypothetical protein
MYSRLNVRLAENTSHHKTYLILANSIEHCDFVNIVSHLRGKEHKFSGGLDLMDICNKKAVRYCEEWTEYLNMG